MSKARAVRGVLREYHKKAKEEHGMHFNVTWDLLDASLEMDGKIEGPFLGDVWRRITLPGELEGSVIRVDILFNPSGELRTNIEIPRDTSRDYAVEKAREMVKRAYGCLEGRWKKRLEEEEARRRNRLLYEKGVCWKRDKVI